MKLNVFSSFIYDLVSEWLFVDNWDHSMRYLLTRYRTKTNYIWKRNIVDQKQNTSPKESTSLYMARL